MPQNNLLQASMTFPPDFLWGTATSSHQVEGGNQNNQWTAWEHAGHVFEGQVSGDACAWWQGRAEEDFARAQSMHNNALRLSIEWSRVEPEPGVWDVAALDRYRTMLLDLRSRGMEPMVTLHHFTNPLWLEERGGWLYEDVARLFARYAVKVVQALGDLVKLWCTINEPMVYAAQSYLFGYFPPRHNSMDEVVQVVASMVQGHVEAYHAIKAIQPAAQIGFAKHQISLAVGIPVVGDVGRRIFRYLFNEAIFGPFNTGVLRMLPGKSVKIPEAKGALDWIGLQYYARHHIRIALNRPDQFFIDQYVPSHVPQGPDRWGELVPEESLTRIKHLYKLVRKPVYVTEMGVPDEDSSIRPAYLARTLRSVWQATMHSMPVKGFFFWSLVDNFEWSEGYDPRFRFGLYGVDFTTQERTERLSAQLYRAICGANALTADAVRTYAPEAMPYVFPTPEGL